MDPIKASSTATRPRLLELPFEILVMILQYYFAALLSERNLTLVNGRFGVHLHACSDELPGRYYTPDPLYKHTVRGCYLKRVGVLYASKTLWKAAQLAAAQTCHGSLVFIITLGGYWEWPSKKTKFYNELSPKIPYYLIREVTFNCGKAERTEQDFDVHYQRFTWKELEEFFVAERWPVLQKVVMRVHTPKPLVFYSRQIGNILRGEHDQKLLGCWEPFLPETISDDPKEIRLHDESLKGDKTSEDSAVTVELYVYEPVKLWVYDWRHYTDEPVWGYISESSFVFALRGKNFKELHWVERTLSAPPIMGHVSRDGSDASSDLAESDAPDELSESDTSSELSDGRMIETTPAMKADGSNWEKKAAKRWPKMKHLLDKERIEEDE